MTKTINYLLGYKDMKIVQDSEMFNFSLDSVLLPNFVTINKSAKKIIDIGCGNAPIPLILSTKTNAKIIGIEIQKEVFELAIDSVKINNKSNQIEIINSDINKMYKEFDSDSIDIITCNPPFFKYKSTSNLNNNIQKTIARHEILLNLEQIFKIAKKLLRNNGVIAIVHRPERLIEILDEMKKNNIEPKKIQFVYPKQNLEANRVLIEGAKNGKSGLKVLPPLYTHLDNGEYTSEIKKYFVNNI